MFVGWRIGIRASEVSRTRDTHSYCNYYSVPHISEKKKERVSENEREREREIGQISDARARKLKLIKK